MPSQSPPYGGDSSPKGGAKSLLPLPLGEVARRKP